MEPLVSIIVPVYNAEEYIRRCVDSILNQEYQNLEILLIDDGSTDQSAAILDEYQAQDARVRAIHRANAGVSASRNCGLDLARGEYIQFADSDDWLTPDSTKLLVRMARNESCDMVIGDFYRVNGKRLSQKGDIEADHVMDRIEFASYMIENPADFYYGVLWNKLFKNDIIAEHHIRMDTELNWCEDFLFNLEYIRYAERFFAIQVPIYYYVKRKGSLVDQSSTFSSTIRMKLNVFDYYNAFYRDVYEENYDDVKQKVRMFLISSAKDNFVMPVSAPGSSNAKLGKERTKFLSPAIHETPGIMADLCRFRKLLEYHLGTAAKLKKLTLDETWLLALFQNRQCFASQKEIAELAGCSVQKINKALQGLKSKDMLEYTIDKKYGVMIFLSDKADECMPEIDHALKELERDCFHDLETENKKELLGCARIVSENIREELARIQTTWSETTTIPAEKPQKTKTKKKPSDDTRDKTKVIPAKA